MSRLAFRDDFKHFDGHCVRFHGFDGNDEVLCGVTTFALKHHMEELPEDGLLPADAFMAAYDRLMPAIREVAAEKYATRRFERSGDVRVMVHDHDWKA